MLGQVVRDPARLESSTSIAAGLGLLPVETTFAPEKATYQARARLVDGCPGWLAGIAGQSVVGYEIHLGQTSGSRPWLEIDSRNGVAVRAADGATAADGRIWGCYLHGLFANDVFRTAWLNSLGAQRTMIAPGADNERSLDRLADTVAGAIDMQCLDRIIQGS
jgi:adenosylcobyric acid synthase